MTKTVVSFGDSFILGSELPNNNNGAQAWPGLIARAIGCNYKTYAVAGCGNDHIARQIYSYFANNPVEDTLAVINWTWIARWDFYVDEDFARWTTLGESCAPDKLSWVNDENKANRMLDFYKEFGQSELWNKFRNLQTIMAVQSYLEEKNIRNIQTYMDYSLFKNPEVEFVPPYLKELQSFVKPKLEQFYQDRNFLEWAKDNNFPITPHPGMHPIGESHQTAVKLWKDRYLNVLYG